MNRGADRELLRRLEALEQRLTAPTPAPLAGQQTLDLRSDPEPDPPAISTPQTAPGKMRAPRPRAST